MFSPVPFGSGSALSGMDFSPWMQGRAQDIQQQLAGQQMAQDALQFVTQLAQRKQESRDMGMRADRELAAMVSNQDATRAEQRRIRDQDIGLAREGAAEQRRIRDEDLGIEASRYADAKAGIESKTAAAKADADAKERGKSDLRQVDTRTRTIIAERAETLRARLSEQAGQPATPEMVRDAMLQSAGQSTVSPEERSVMQAAIEDWYQSAVDAEKRDKVKPEKDPAVTATPATKLSYWRSIERDSADEAETLTGILNAMGSNDPDMQEFAKFAMTKYGGEAGVRTKLTDLQKQLEEARAQLATLLAA